MGCDIHMFVEYKKDSTWVEVEHYIEIGNDKVKIPIYDGRNYELFGILAGVRCDVIPIDTPRGLPSDISDSVKIEYDKYYGDAHTPHYYTLRELVDYKYKMLGDMNQSLKNILDDLLMLSDKISQYEYFLPRINFNNIRIVFWFDN